MPPRPHRGEGPHKAQDNNSSGSEGNSPQMAPAAAAGGSDSARLPFVVSSSSGGPPTANAMGPPTGANPYADPWSAYYGAYMDPSMMYSGYTPYEMAAAWYNGAAQVSLDGAPTANDTGRPKPLKIRHGAAQTQAAQPSKAPQPMPPKPCFLVRVQYHILHTRFHRHAKGFAAGTWVTVSDSRGASDLGVVVSCRPFISCTFDDDPVAMQPATARERQTARELEQAAAAVLPTITQVIVNNLSFCNFTQRIHFLAARFRAQDRLVVYYQSSDLGNSPRVLIEPLLAYYPNCEFHFERLPNSPWHWAPLLGVTDTHSPPPSVDDLSVIQPTLPPLDWPHLRADWDQLPEVLAHPRDPNGLPKAETVLVWVQHHALRTEVYLSSVRYDAGVMVTVEGDPGIDAGTVVAAIPAEDVPVDEHPPVGTRRVLGRTTAVDALRYHAAALKALHVMTVLSSFPQSDLDPLWNDGQREPLQFLGAHFQPDLQKLFLFHRGYLLRDKISNKLFCRYQCRIWFEEIHHSHSDQGAASFGEGNP